MTEEQLRKLVEYAEPKPKSFLCVSLDGGKMWMDIHIPTGCYEIKAINDELHHEKNRG